MGLLDPPNNLSQLIGATAARVAAETAAGLAQASANAAAASAALTNRPAVDKTYYVSTAGSDSNTGLSPEAPFLTIDAAITAIGTTPGLIEVGRGTFSFSTTISRRTGQSIRGAGKYGTTLSYTGAGTAINTAVTGVRIYGAGLSDFSLITTTGAVGVDLDSVSLSDHYSVNVTGFSDACWRIRSSVSGGSVYNTFTGCLGLGKGPATASIGFDLQAAGSNSNNFFGCSARNNGIGLKVVDSNHAIWVGGTFELDGIGVFIEATSVSLANSNIIQSARFESNTVNNWCINSANVIGAKILDPAEFTNPGSINNGLRSKITAQSSTGSGSLDTSAGQIATGSWRYERSANGGSEVPAFVIADTVNSSGTPVTLQVETERTAGYPFRAKRAGTTYWDVDAAGNMRQPQGSYIEMTERTDPSAPATNNARIYSRDVGGLTEFAIRFPSGSVQTIASESLAKGKVDKGTLVFNVKDYGAVGDWSSGTTGTVDTAAINACLAAAATAAGSGVQSSVKVYVPPSGAGNGYVINDTIVTPINVEWDMQGQFVYTGPAGRPAMTIGSTATNQQGKEYKIRLRRAVFSTWLDEADVGLELRNLNVCDIHLLQVNNFTVGVTCIGDNSKGFVYNNVYLGALTDNAIALDITNDTAGWANENTFYGGRFAVSSTTNLTLDRVGIRITSRATSKYTNNANRFYAPSFEMNGQAASGNSTLMQVDYGSVNIVENARSEGNDTGVLVQNNTSEASYMSFAYADAGVAFVNNSTQSSGGVSRLRERMIDDSLRTIYKANAIHKAACYYDGATQVNVPGLTVGGGTDLRGTSNLVINAEYLEIPSGRFAGFYMSTRLLKTFTLIREAEAGFGGRFMVRCYDSTGANISQTATVKSAGGAGTPAYTASYGGTRLSGADATGPMHFNVSSDVDYVFVGVTGGTAVARIRSIAAATSSAITPSTWLAFEDYGQNYATTPPTAGTWPVGKTLINANPSNGIISWVCVAAGTPGTWIANLSNSNNVQVFTSDGTWTAPPNISTVRVYVIGAGTGGGSGRRGAAGTICSGGGGGGSGGFGFAEIPAAIVGSSVAVTVPAGGLGGAAVTTDDTNGNAGAKPLNTAKFGNFVTVQTSGAVMSNGGTAVSGSGGVPGLGQFWGVAGGTAGGGVGGAGAISQNGTAGPGGGGGGISAANVAAAGGIGGYNTSTAPSGGSIAGAIDGNAPAQTAVTGVPGWMALGIGGAGGGSSITGPGGNGAAGGLYGSGGGGGGASRNGQPSGAGGQGGPAIVVVVSS